MTSALLTETDARVRDMVLHQLEWDSQVDESQIGVTAKDGAVTLTGFIDSYAGKLAAERAAKRVKGVRAVANDLQVRLRLEFTDADIAADAARALTVRISLPHAVQAVVHHGVVTLTGTVTTLFQRAVAENAMRHIPGVKSVINRIDTRLSATPRDVRREIVRALHRDADLDARRITVTVAGHTVTLTGTVGSWHERTCAERAAMHAPGITEVDNRLSVAWPTDELAIDPDAL